MFHFSTDRLAGLDTMILKITTPKKVPTLIPNRSLHHDTYVPARKLKKQKPHRETRRPLVDKTASNNLAPHPPHPTSSMFLHTLPTTGEVTLFSPNDSSSPQIPCPPDIFRPLPPLPSASTLQLPSFLNFSTQSSPSLADPPPCSAASLPPSVLFRVSSSPVASSRHVVVRKTKNNKVFEGPQWIPAFHHPNSPYVPWSSSVRRRILPPSLPLSPSPVCPSSPCIRSGAVAPEPWASPTSSQAFKRPGKQIISSSWKSFKNSIKKGVKVVVSHLGKSRKSLRTLCIGQGMLCTYDDNDAAIVAPNSTSHAMQATSAKAQIRGFRDSLASFVSSDSRTLTAWLAERRAIVSCIIDNTGEMSVEEYELVGSWLDLGHYDGGWACGVENCGMHTPSGSPYAASEYPDGLRMAMPFDSADLLSSGAHPSRAALAWPLPSGPFSAPPRFHSLPRLPCQSFDIHSAQQTKSAALKDAERCLTICRELSMPGGWTFS